MAGKTKTTGAARHARMGPSGYKSREICPSYKSDDESSHASLEGDMLHDVMEKLVERAVKQRKPIELATSPEVLALDDERQMSMLEMVVSYVNPILVKAGFKVELEVELDLQAYKLKDTDFGTADLIAYDEKQRTFDLVDYKFGWIEVDDAEENIQGWLYALGAFSRHAKATGGMVHFLQPRRDELSTGTFSRDDVPNMLLRARTVNDRVHQLAGHTFNPVAENCLWCANKASCGAMHAMALKLEGKIPMKFPTSVKQWNPEQLTDPKQAADLWAFADVMFKWGAAVRNRVVQMAQDGYEIPGHDLKSRAGRTSIIDLYRAVEIAQTEFKVQLDTLDDFLKVAEPSLHGLEAAIGALQPRGEKGNSKTKFREALAKEGLLEIGRPSAWLEPI